MKGRDRMKPSSKKILSFGSLNIDHVYQVENFVRPGGTIASESYHRFAGGKGLNQSLAMARAGARVFHAGKIGADGLWLKQLLSDSGVDTGFVEVGDGPCGHAIIQVNRDGENAILINGGANRKIGVKDLPTIFRKFAPGDFLVIQNETSAVPEIIKAAATSGMQIVFNPAPMGPEVLKYPLRLVDYFIVNEVEGAALTGHRGPEEILTAMRKKFPRASVVLTLGAKGAAFAAKDNRFSVPAVKVKAVDSTAAGDAFIGYFVAGVAAGESMEQATRTASEAAAICVTRAGAAASIPFRRELSRQRKKP